MDPTEPVPADVTQDADRPADQNRADDDAAGTEPPDDPYTSDQGWLPV